MFTRGPYLGIRTLALTLIAIVLMICDRRQFLEPLRSTLSVVVAPVQYIVDWPFKTVDFIETNLATRKSLLKENASLRANQLLLESKLQKLATLQKENTELRTLLNASPHNSGERVLVAQLLAVDANNFTYQVVLDKGSKDGVYVNQPVLDANGIMGQVIQVGPLTSRVLLITDSRSAIPVENSRNGLRGLVVGQVNNGQLSLANIANTTDFKVGDTLISSGLDGRFPAGYSVGVVSSVAQTPGEHFADIRVKPSAHLNRLQPVLLLWQTKSDATTMNDNNAQKKMVTKPQAHPVKKD